MAGWMWLLATVVGVAILGVALAFGRRATKRVDSDPAAVQHREQTTRQLYAEEEERRQS